MHADGLTVSGVAISGGMDNRETVVVGAALTLGDTGRTVTGGATDVGAVDEPDDEPGARVVAVEPELVGATTVEPGTAAPSTDDGTAPLALTEVLEDSLSTTSVPDTTLSEAADGVGSLDLDRLHTTIAMPRTKTMIETEVSHFRAMGEKYQMPGPPRTNPKS